ncbi:hypothetical protein LJC11_01875 [Bacteroidales bacterium OttesenSCG-928-I21]|nr:hypothetical protein [Bacteroidales bacterium OttesenSCG-928-I21]
MQFKYIYNFLLLLFISYYSYGQVNKIDLTWESGGEFQKTKITITLKKNETEKYTLNFIEEKICDLCKDFNNKIIKERNIFIAKNDFDRLLNAIKLLDITELNNNNNFDFFIWFPPTMKLVLYENDIDIFSIKYVSPQQINDFPIPLYPLNKIVQDIFKLAGIKSKKYCPKM